MHEEIHHSLISIRCWNNLQQAHIAHRIEEVGAAEILFKIVASALCHQVNGDTRCVGCYQRSFGPVLFDLFKNLLFYIQSLYHYFNDPVTVFDF
jgi:hypothetical protein